MRIGAGDRLGNRCLPPELLIGGEWTDKRLIQSLHLDSATATVYREDIQTARWPDEETEVIVAPFRIRFPPELHDDPDLLVFVAHAQGIGCTWDPDTLTLEGGPK